MSTVPALIWSPFGDLSAARECIATLLDEGLIACANIIPGLESHFTWNGEREQSTEVGVLFKTSTDLLELAVARITEVHPYDAPAVAGWAADRTNPATSAWLGMLGVTGPGS